MAGLVGLLATVAAPFLACNRVLGIDGPARREATHASDAGGDAAPACEGAGCLTCAFPAVECGNTCVDLGADDGNCGACGRSCRGQGCNSGRCNAKVVVSDLVRPVAMRPAGDMLYWYDDTTMGLPSLGRVATEAPTCRGPECGVPLDTTAYPLSLLVTPTFLYLGRTQGGLLRFQRDFTPLADNLTLPTVNILVAEGETLFSAHHSGPYVYRSYGGAGQETVITTRFDARKMSATSLAVREGTLYVGLISVDPSVESGIYSVPTNSACFLEACPSVVAGTDVVPWALADTPAALFAIVHPPEQKPLLMRYAHDAPPCHGLHCGTLLAQVEENPAGTWTLAADERWVYWGTAHAIRRVAADGGPCGDACEVVADGYYAVVSVGQAGDFAFAGITTQVSTNLQRFG